MARTNNILKSLQLPRDQRAMCPRYGLQNRHQVSDPKQMRNNHEKSQLTARIRNVQMISPLLRLEPTTLLNYTGERSRLLFRRPVHLRRRRFYSA